MQTMTIIFIWLGSTIPEMYDKKVKECVEKYQNCILIGEKEYKELAQKYNFASHADNKPVKRADLLKLLYLYENGGIYMDLDNEVRDWVFLKQLNCQDTYFGEEQWNMIYYAKFQPSNYMICSPKKTAELARLIKGIKQTGKDQVVQYAGPIYLINMKVKIMPFYPNIKHCYHNNWLQTLKSTDCVTPDYGRGGRNAAKPT